jgi:hypothetical protein
MKSPPLRRAFLLCALREGDPAVLPDYLAREGNQNALPERVQQSKHPVMAVWTFAQWTGILALWTRMIASQ